MSSKNYDAVIIGGGHNGLVAATYLARAGKSVRILEANPEIGGATQSVRSFPEYDANLSRYSYLVALLPDKIVSDLGLSFECISREVSSYTPYGDDKGLYVSRIWDSKTEDSFNQLDPTGNEGREWQTFYAEIAEFAEKIAPTLLEPLKTRSELKSQIDLDAISMSKQISMVFDDNTMKEVFYDDSFTLSKKYAFAMTQGLKGVGLWALGYDSQRYELWNLIDETFSTNDRSYVDPIGEVNGFPIRFAKSLIKDKNIYVVIIIFLLLLLLLLLL